MKWLDRLKQAVKLETKSPGPGEAEKTLSTTLTYPAAELFPPDLSEENQAVLDEQAVATLSPRERQVFHRLLEGAKMKDIADEIGIQTSTVNGYCREVYKKLGVNSKALLILRYGNYHQKDIKGGDE